MKNQYCRTTPTENFPDNFEHVPGMRTLLNPGSMADLHKRTRDIMPQWLEGVRLSLKTNYKTNAIIYSNWILSHKSASGFNLGGVYNVKLMENILSTPMIEADINPSTLAGNFAFTFFPKHWLRLDYSTQFGVSLSNDKNKTTAHQTNSTTDDIENKNNIISMEYIGKSMTFTINTYNINNRSGRITLSYLQSITSYFAMGSELLLEWNKGMNYAQTALALRYSEDKSALAATMSFQAVDASYWCVINERLQCGSSLVYNRRNYSSIASIFYQYELDDTKIRGMIDSKLSIGFTYYRFLRELSCNLGFSLLLCIPTNKFICGFKLEFEYPDK